MALLENLGFLGSGANDAPGVLASKEDIEARRKLARALMLQASDTSPVQHWTQGAARIAQALQGVTADWAADRDARAGQEAWNKEKADSGAFGLSGNTGVTPAAPAAQTTGSLSPPGNIPKVAAAMAGYDPKLVDGRTFQSNDETGAKIDEYFEQGAKRAGLTNPAFEGRLLSFVNDNPHGIGITSLDRTNADQARLYANRANNPYPVAPPGGSAHNRGTAADFSFETPEARAWAQANAAKYGLAFPHANDPIHVEMRGDGAPQQASTPHPFLGAKDKPVQVASNDPAFMPQRSASVAVPQQGTQEGQPQPAAPVQVAQAPQQQGATGGASLARLLALTGSRAYEYASPGEKKVIEALIQKKVSQEEKTPAQIEKEQLELQGLRDQRALSPLQRRQQELAVQKAEKDANAVEFDRIQDQNGTFWERRKGTADPWQQVSGPTGKDKSAVADVEDRKAAAERIGIKPDDPAYKSYIATGKMPREDAQPLSATDKKAIIEADESIAASKSTIQALERAKQLSKEAYDGPLASKRAYVTSLFGSEGGKKTLELDNLVTAQALENLKATFGAAPTEGERKILLDIQGSSNQPPDVRERIFQRAIDAANRRIKFNEDRAAQLRGGTYYKPEQGKQATPQPQTAPASNGPRILSVEPIR